MKRLFAVTGRIDRFLFAAIAIPAAIAYWSTANAALLLLPVLAVLTAPLGINAGLVLNAVWGLLALLAIWIVTAASAQRLRDAGQTPWLAVLILPLLTAGAMWLLPLIGPELIRRLAASATGPSGMPIEVFQLFGGTLAIAGASVLTICLTARTHN